MREQINKRRWLLLAICSAWTAGQALAQNSPLSQFLSNVSTNRTDSGTTKIQPTAGLQGFFTGTSPANAPKDSGVGSFHVIGQSVTNSAKTSVLSTSPSPVAKDPLLEFSAPVAGPTDRSDQFLKLTTGPAVVFSGAPSIDAGLSTESSGLFAGDGTTSRGTESAGTTPDVPKPSMTTSAPTSKSAGGGPFSLSQTLENNQLTAGNVDSTSTVTTKALFTALVLAGAGVGVWVFRKKTQHG